MVMSERYAPSCHAPLHKVFAAPLHRNYSCYATMDQKWRYEAICLIAETLAGEGYAAVDAGKRAKVVVADLRDAAEPRRFWF
jgi:hypothetical protein